MFRFPSSHQAGSPGLPSRTIIRSTAGSLFLTSHKGINSTGREKSFSPLTDIPFPSAAAALAPPLRITLELSTLIMYCLS